MDQKQTGALVQSKGTETIYINSIKIIQEWTETLTTLVIQNTE